jgi:hypothetical protein
MKTPVTVTAVVGRINRRLTDGERLKKSRGAQEKRNLGDYYIFNIHLRCVTTRHIDLEALARERNVLAPWEKIVHDGLRKT